MPEQFVNGEAGYENGHIPRTLRSGLDEFYMATGMNADNFTAILEKFQVGVERRLEMLTSEVRKMSDEAIGARGEHQEMRRELAEHEDQLHGVSGEPGLITKVDRLEQKVKGFADARNRTWDWLIGVAIGVGIALMVHWLKIG